MPTPDRDAVLQLPGARVGSSEALGRVLEDCRGYLLSVAQRELDRDLQAKGGASDVVQQTMLDAVANFERFQGDSDAELRVWLRRLLLNNLTDFTRLYRATGKRRISRETPLDAGDSSAVGDQGLAADVSTPSGQAIERERDEAIQRALERLPDRYRRLIELRYLEERSFEEIAQALGVSANAARKLWARALDRLQQETQGSQ